MNKFIDLRNYYKEHSPTNWLFEEQNVGAQYSSRSLELVLKEVYE